ncbi:MAG: glycine--tRNA ligase subunit beta, partial [Candidatus Promineifilaceae bacterium]|nr:glycine--tRNA ligase subunit beta [Candidatus Promineifilaceae bacterium]
MRRAAIQIVENLVGNGVEFDLRAALDAALPLLPVEAGQETVTAVLTFLGARLETYLQEEGVRTSVVRAVIAEQGHNPFGAYRAATALEPVVEAPSWPPLLDAYARCVRITRDQPPYDLQPDAFAEIYEQELLAAYREAAELVDGTVEGLLAALKVLEPAITRFFDHVLVMAEDEAVRQNRLALLQRIAALTEGTADLSQLEGF